MGHKFEVKVRALIETSNAGETSVDNYQWNVEYSGEDRVQAYYAMEELKRKGAKCVKLTWR